MNLGIVTGHVIGKVEEQDVNFITLLISQKLLRSSLLVEIEDEYKSLPKKLTESQLKNLNGGLIGTLAKVIQTVVKCDDRTLLLIIENPRQLLWDHLLEVTANH